MFLGAGLSQPGHWMVGASLQFGGVGHSPLAAVARITLIGVAAGPKGSGWQVARTAAPAGVNPFDFQSWKHAPRVIEGRNSSGCVFPEWRRLHHRSAPRGHSRTPR